MIHVSAICHSTQRHFAICHSTQRHFAIEFQIRSAKTQVQKSFTLYLQIIQKISIYAEINLVELYLPQRFLQ